jgi:hypothetical protein
MPKYIPPGSAELAVYIDKDLKQQFKLICAIKEESMSTIANGIVKDYVEKNKPDINPFAKR